MAFKMKGFGGFGNSPLKKQTSFPDKVITGYDNLFKKAEGQIKKAIKTRKKIKKTVKKGAQKLFDKYGPTINPTVSKIKADPYGPYVEKKSLGKTKRKEYIKGN